MAHLLVVSPHLDDAVLSVGQVLAGHPDAAVATMASSTPKRGRQATSYDQACGFRTASQAMAARRREDTAALAGLGVGQLHLGLLDSQYRNGGHPIRPEAIATALCVAIDAQGAEVLLGPLGLAHPDHIATSEACVQAWRLRPRLELWLYEELPARVLWPELVAERLHRMQAEGRPELAFLGTGPLADKQAAVDAYASQGAALSVATQDTYPHAVLVPERVWRVWPDG